MPWHLEENYQTCKGWAVVKDDDGSIAGCHGDDKTKAEAQLAALYIAEERQVGNDEQARSLFETFWDGLKSLFTERTWSGSASNYDSAEAYCKACLIDLNAAAGRDEKTKEFCMLPVKRPGSDSIDPEGLQAAAGGRGITRVQKPKDVPQDAWDKALKAAANTIISNYPKLLDKSAPDSVYEIAGKEPPAERAMANQLLFENLINAMPQLNEQDGGSDNWLIDVYHDNGGMYALFADRGKLYRHQLTIQNDNVVLGERVPVMEMHVPVTQSRTVIRQQENGRHRWFSISATAALNLVGEIDSRDLFDSFAAYAEATGEYPIRQFYHQGEVFRTGQADFLARDGYCYITSGLYDDTPLGQAEVKARLANPNYWGDSIGFLPTSEPELIEITNGIKIPVYRQGINKEISTLPESEAASLFTNRTEVTRMSFTEKVWNAWLKLWEDDKEQARKWLEDHPEERNRAIEAAGIITRNNDNEKLEPETEPSPKQEQQEHQEIAVDDEVLTQLTERVGKADFMTDLVKRFGDFETAMQEMVAQNTKLAQVVAKLTQRLEAIEVDEDKKRQQWLEDLPARAKRQTRVVYRPRIARDREVEDEPVDEMAAWQEEKKNKKIPSY